MSNTLKVEARGEREIVMTRAFDAPRELVFAAWTQPELVKRWLYGPDGWHVAACDMDLRVDGKLRFVWRHRDGREMGMGGVYREVTPPERLVHTELFDEDWTGGEALVTMVLTERAGKTTVTQTVLYSSRAARDGVLKSPMESGLAPAYARLDALLSSLAERRDALGAA